MRTRIWEFADITRKKKKKKKSVGVVDGSPSIGSGSLIWINWFLLVVDCVDKWLALMDVYTI